MINKEDSSFLQGVEGRLDSLSGAENKKQEDSNDQSKVISEIEKRFNAIFGEDNKEVKSEAKAEGAENNSIDQVKFNPPTVEEIIFRAEQADSKSFNQLPSELVSSNSGRYSPLKDIKNIILSLEGEIDSGILDKYDTEISKLQALNEGDSTILGFLQILRFLGRYLRVKGIDSNRGSMALLLSVSDNLEDVILSEDMTPENKRAILMEDINDYREWADEIGGVADLFDLNSEKKELDLFLSSITEAKAPPVAASVSPAETSMPVVFPSYNEPKTKITDDEIGAQKRERTPFTIDKPSGRQSYNIDRSEEIRQSEPEDVTGHKITWIAMIIVFIILFSMAVGFLWFYPQRKTQALQWMVSNIPYADRVLIVENAPKNPDSDKIGFIDVQQRFIRNTSMGRNIRVVEGIVKNNTNVNLFKVKVLGELYNSEGLLLLTSRTSLAGNVLADDNLEKLDEDKIFSALSIAPVSNLSEARIPPLGQVPFMIVFTREPPGVFKLVVTPVLE